MTDNELLQQAKQAMQHAYAPYSGYKVGAALLCADGSVYLGCNIENASYSLTSCAERTALFTAVAAGQRSFVSLAVVGGQDGDLRDFAYPCGACRQALSEFCGADFRVILGKDGGETKVTTLGELLPSAFKLAQEAE